MSTTTTEAQDKPLHVQVAEALGWEDIYHNENGWWGWAPIPKGSDPYRTHGTWMDVPRYDTDWSATGPLIEEYQITVMYRNNVEGAFSWWADYGYYEYLDGSSADVSETGDTPLLAVCNLILALKEAGKLPPLA